MPVTMRASSGWAATWSIHPSPKQRLRYPATGTECSYRGRRVHPLTGQDRVELDPLEMLARLCQHIPPPGFHTTRLYGAYSNRTRAARARTLTAAQGREPDDHDADTSAPHTFPTRAPKTVGPPDRQGVRGQIPCVVSCGATMRIVAVVVEPPVIRKILDHLAYGPRREPTRRPAAG